MGDLAEGQSIFDFEPQHTPLSGVLLALAAVTPFWIAAAWMAFA